MIEFLYICFSVFFLCLLVFVPINNIFFINKKNLEINIFDYTTLNILIFSNILLIFAILKISISFSVYIFYLLIFLTLFLFKKFLKNNILKKEVYYYFSFLFLIFFILSIDIAYYLTLGWDAQSIWFPKAISFYNDESLTEISKFSRHPEYPFFGSLSWAFFWKFFHLEKEYIGRFFYLLIFLISIFNFVDILRISKTKKFLLSLIIISLIYDYWHFRGYQEIIIFSLILIISKYLYFIFCENETKIKFLIIILISSNLVIWTKNEGIFFILFIHFLLLFSKYEKKIKILNIILVLILISFRFLIFKIYNLEVGLQDNYNFSNIFMIFLENLTLSNIIFIMENIFLTIFKFPIILVSLIFSLILLFDKSVIKNFLFVYIYLLIHLGFIFIIYLSTSTDVNWMVVTGLNRVFFEASSIYLLFPIFYLKIKFKI
tara:strand:+ start:1764 stop:3059 length:1296 start_codon:yes stop_codon:yes gene_type:complete